MKLKVLPERFLLIVLLKLFELSFCFCELNPYRHVVIPDPDGNYRLEWLVDWEQERVIFNITVNTRGMVGFGLALKANRTGADIVLGGVGKDGRSYFSDRHSFGNGLPTIDEYQDYILHEARERNSQTFLSFSRPFDTCDEDQDLPISNDLLTIIWGYSDIDLDDEAQSDFQHTGTFQAYLLDPDLAPRNERGEVVRLENENIEGGTKVFNITGRMERVPIQETTYWCNYHRVPTKSKQHIIGFNPVLPTESDTRHIHHLILYRCYAPAGMNPETFYEGHTRNGGHECYINAEPETMAATYCSEVLYAWAVGGRAIFLPEHVGLPMSENGMEYFMLETHYDNPNLLPNLNVSITLEAYYTVEIRPNDVGVLWIGQLSPGATTLVIPPDSTNHIALGHCASECTRQAFGNKPIHIIATLLHTHTSGAGVRALHFRGQTELPWINGDDNYNFNYQQFRILKQERTVLPGDQLIMRCVYDVSTRNSSAVTGGFSTRQEMCNTLLFYYNRLLGVSNCLSEIRSEEYFRLLGVSNITWDRPAKDMVVRHPPEFSGLTMRDYTNDHIEWDVEMRNELERQQIFGPQVSMCPNARPGDGEDTPDGSESNSLGDGAEEDSEFISRLPTGTPRYTRPPQCTRRGE
ncbi:unnamed protein product [Orchesella dallaii]|uniref:DOMON domain-containing protein n=1 Tax=Orchesella dallaii TaxID=48710 RepID=A0ABP1RP18_9HEXA